MSVILLFAVIPASIAAAIWFWSFHRGGGAWAIDFNGNFVFPARDILRGVSPYDPSYLANVRDLVAAGHAPDRYSDGVFVTYPAPTLLIGVPFTYLPMAVAEWLWLGLMLACGALALRVAGARDWRVYGAALLTPAFSYSLIYGTMDCLLMLSLAAVWHWRRNAARGGIALGVAIALKLLFVPLLAWLVFTRRFAAAAIACGCSAVLWLVGWAVIGFDGFTGYPHLISLLTEIENTKGYSSVAYASELGLGDGAASAVPYALGVLVIAALWLVVRNAAPRADERGFLLAVVAVMAFSPIVWQHYLSLMFVPLAILQPRLSWAWLVPSLLWLTPFAAFQYGGTIEQIVFAAAMLGTIVAAFGPRALVRTASDVFRQRARPGTLPAWR